MLPPTALRVVVVGAGSSGGGLDKELGGVLESRLWTESPERTLVFVPAATESQEVRASTTRRTCYSSSSSSSSRDLPLERGSCVHLLAPWGVGYTTVVHVDIKEFAGRRSTQPVCDIGCFCRVFVPTFSLPSSLFCRSDKLPPPRPPSPPAPSSFLPPVSGPSCLLRRETTLFGAPW